MSDMNKALELYTLMAKRCENSQVAPNQARVYWEMIDFMKPCATVEEAMIKIKDSKYYLAPSVALIQDKIMAYLRVAKENEMAELEVVYKKKLHEIETDNSAIYSSDYLVTAQNIKIRYVHTMEAYGAIYEAYCTLRCCVANDEVTINNALKDMKEAFLKLDLPSSDFVTLSKLKRFRNLILASDNEYNTFVKEVSIMISEGFSYAKELDTLIEESTSVWQRISDIKDTILDVGVNNLSYSKQARTTVVAPMDASGNYSYIDEEVH